MKDTTPIETKLLQFCADCRLIAAGDSVCATVSGGTDSMALLQLLCALRETLQISLSAAHFNHRLRGAESDRDERFVREQCVLLGIPLTVGSGDAAARAAETGESIEEAARKLRYAFFETLDADKIATAHTADDNAETLLLNLLRGTGPRGLCGIPPVNGNIIRPLLSCTRAETEDYLQNRALPHVEDSSNASDDCVRNRLRHKVMPLLTAENPRFAEAVRRTCALQREEEEYLSALAADAERDCAVPGGLSCGKLRQLHPVLRRRVLLSALRQRRPEAPAMQFVQALDALVFSDSPSARISLPEGLTAARVYDLLVFRGEPLPGSFAPVELPVPGSVRIPELGMTVTCSVTKNSNICRKKAEIFLLKYDMICQTVSLRPRRVGDMLNGRSVKRRMIDRKIPAAERERCPVLEIDGSVAAVYGLGVSETRKPAEGDSALEIEFYTEENSYGSITSRY